jgi:rod shape-determining protein MreC
MHKLFSKQTATVIAAAFVIIIAHYTGLLVWAERSITAVFNPVAGIFFRSGSALESVAGGQIPAHDLAAENSKLAAQNQKLLQENITLQLLKDENEALRAQLEFYTTHAYRKVLANVVSRTSASDNSQTITLDVGSADGIQPGQPVVTGNGILAGKVVSVDEHLTHACLLVDTNCHFAATMAEREGPSGLTQGDLGLTVRMDFVPQTETIQAGDTIITSGLEASVPAGLLIGSVQSVQDEPNNLFQTAIIDPAADLATVRVVSVVTD